MKGVIGLFAVLLMSSLVMAASTSSSVATFNVIDGGASADVVTTFDGSLGEPVDDTNYVFYGAALVIVLAVVFVFWKLSKRKK